jgi:tripartite-type tricarboxylate transporter receptor subunit TctC
MLWKKSVIGIISSVLGLLAMVLQAQAATDFPTKPVRIILPYAAGSINDNLLRMVLNELTPRWKQQYVVEGRPGAAGRVAYEAAAKSSPDGHTLVMAVSSLTTLPYLYKDLNFDPRKDLVGVTMMFQHAFTISIAPTIPARTYEEFISWAKANQGKVNYGTQGQGNVVHLTYELINNATGAGMTAIHYQGTAAVKLAAQRGELQAVTDTFPLQMIDPSGTPFRPLAIVSDRRILDQPGLRTLKEAGQFEATPVSWNGLFAPSGTPKDVVEKIASDIRSVMLTPEMADKYKKSYGAIIIADTPDEFAHKLQIEFRFWGDMIKRLNFSAQ